MSNHYFYGIMKRIFTLAAIAAAVANIFSAQAETVTIEAGGLKSAVASDPAAVTALTVNGTMDASDFAFITSELTALKTLDLTAAAPEGDAIPECGLMVASLEDVKLPKELKTLGQGALGGTAIRTVELPATLTTIGHGAFAECKNLTALTIPAGVSDLGAAFAAGCTALESATVGAGVGILPDRAFEGCAALTSVSLPKTLTAIGADAFSGCKTLADVTMPESLTSIGDHAFYGAGLVGIDLTGCTQLTTIGEWAFAKCPYLEMASMPANLKTLGRGVFYNATSMALSAVPEGVETVGDFALTGVAAGDDKNALTLPEGLTSLGAYALADWNNIEVLTIPPTLESIGDKAMANWTSLKQIDASKAVTIPTLGAEVWKGVPQAEAYLDVPKTLFEGFSTADQWKEFQVRAASSELTELPQMSGAEGLKVRFQRPLIIVESAGAPIAGVQVYDMAGRLFSFPLNNDGTTATVDTSAWNAPTVIVRVELADHSAAAIKLSLR